LLPFTTQQFFSVFADYNQAVWPMQWILAAAAAGIVLLSISRVAWKDRAICVLLAGLWAWMAIAYHVAHFSRINPAAFLFAALYLVEAGLLARWAITGRRLELRYRGAAASALGVAMLAYSLVAYPLLGLWLGHAYPASPTFGVPCPTTIFTLGILALAHGRHVATLAVAPLLWSVIGGSAAFLLGIWQDLGLIASGIALAALLVARRRRARR
jgi:hypothetical protein